MTQASPAFAALEQRIDALGAEAPENTVSVWLGDLSGHVRHASHADRAHYAASTMKLPLVLAYQRDVVSGRLDPERAVPVHNAFHSVADGSVFALDPADDQDPDTWAAIGSTRTAAQLAEHAITHSGNLATNLLLDLVGAAAVAAVLADVGCSPTTVVGRGIEDAVARERGISNVVTAADLGLLLAAVGRREPALGGDAVCGPVEAVLRRQQHVDQIPAGLPPGIPTASKSGWVPGISHDAALIWPPDRPASVLVICTTIDRDEADAAALVASIASAVWAADTADGAGAVDAPGTGDQADVAAAQQPPAP
ncbi:MAG: class A beta-lactamase-related serine hydrolase [Humibacillus sp.]|nr:class A beta-lactamase-related serine hydrolase [Humibacillus sp.]MDN5775854.1 class A beta-lactamase-related serine hydrolase [Humibacillus sp.]